MSKAFDIDEELNLIMDLKGALLNFIEIAGPDSEVMTTL